MFARSLVLALAACLLWGPSLARAAAPPFDPAALAEEKQHFAQAEALDLEAQIARQRALAAGDGDRDRLTERAMRLERQAEAERDLAAQARTRVFHGAE